MWRCTVALRTARAVGNRAPAVAASTTAMMVRLAAASVAPCCRTFASTAAGTTAPPPPAAKKKGGLGSSQLSRKAAAGAGKVAAVNVASMLQLPSPSARSAPFPHGPSDNQTRAWRPREAAPPVQPTAALLTTPIFYANGAAHIGHLSTTVMMDALNRWNNLTAATAATPGERASWLISGTDEHGSKVAEAAARNGVPSAEYVRQISLSFHQLFERAHIHLDDYIRTTEERHFAVAQAVWARLHELGYIYLGHHSGYYSRVDEAFLPESQIEARTTTDATGVTTTTHHDRETGNRVEFQSEKNYKFRLSAFRSVLIEWITSSNPPVIEPPSRRNEILSFLNSTPLEDISVSRLKSKVDWGIPLPPSSVISDGNPTANELAETADEYQSHVMYVWLDALSNYLTVSGITPAQVKDVDQIAHAASPPLWPPHTQLIGKDILRFHTIYWPAFLIGLNLPAWKDAPRDPNGQLHLASSHLHQLPLALPRRVVAHAHWLVERTKMSKSLGNVIDPNQLLDDFGVDPVRFFLLRDSQLADDSNFSAADVIKRLHSDLADTFGNLLNRCIGATLLPDNALPSLDAQLLATHPYSADELKLISDLNELPMKLAPLMSSLRFGEAINTVFAQLWSINAYYNQVEPWTFRKEARRLAALPTPTEAELAQLQLANYSVAKTLYLCLENLRCVAILLQPIMPESMSKLLWRLAVPEDQRRLEHAVFGRSVVPFPSEAPSSSSSSATATPPVAPDSSAPAPVFVLFQKLADDRVAELTKKYAVGAEKAAQEATAAAAEASAKKKAAKQAKKASAKPQPSAPAAVATSA